MNHLSNERLIPPSLAFRFSAPCMATSAKWSDAKGISLTENHRLPCFGELDDTAPFADVRAGWSKDGMLFQLRVPKKRQSLWCRDTQLTESDGIQIWIDTRDTHNVHRANRFCHWFLFLPSGGGVSREEPVATMLRINRAKEDPKTLNQVQPKVVAQMKIDGYRLDLMIPKHALTGWDPSEHTKIGFQYAVLDRELGCQSFSVDKSFPISEDPSLWQTLELTR